MLASAKYVLSLAIGLIFLLGCQEDKGIRGTSVMEIYSNPKLFSGSTVFIKGFLGDKKHGRSALYLTRDDAVINNTEARVVITDKNWEEIVNSCGWSFVEVKGQYRYAKKFRGHLLEHVDSVLKLIVKEDGKTASREKCYGKEKNQ